MTTYAGAEGVDGAGLHGYALVGTMPVTEEPEGPRIWDGHGASECSDAVYAASLKVRLRAARELWLTYLAFAVVLRDDSLHEVDHAGG